MFTKKLKITIFKFKSALLITTVVFSILQPNVANAVQSAPRTSASIYVYSTNTSTAYSQGCSQGRADIQIPSQSSEVILDFGTINSSGTGTILIGSTANATFAQINSYAEQFAFGYYVCTSTTTTSTLNLGIGTNNSSYYVSSTGGALWANSAVLPVKTWVSSNISQVTVLGANDMELSWATSTATTAWVQGFSNTAVAGLINYGSADGCPQSTYSNGACNNGWNQNSVWFISWGNPASFSLPEIYYNSQSLQWSMISKYAYTYKSGRIYFDGPLTQYGTNSTLTSNDAWTRFWTDLNTYFGTAINFAFRSDI